MKTWETAFPTSTSVIADSHGKAFCLLYCFSCLLPNLLVTWNNASCLMYTDDPKFYATVEIPSGTLHLRSAVNSVNAWSFLKGLLLLPHETKVLSVSTTRASVLFNW